MFGLFCGFMLCLNTVDLMFLCLIRFVRMNVTPFSTKTTINGSLANSYPSSTSWPNSHLAQRKNPVTAQLAPESHKTSKFEEKWTNYLVGTGKKLTIFSSNREGRCVG